jgi:AraC-like DNA-binding protein
MNKADGFLGQRTNIIPEKVIEKIKEDPISQPLYITDIGYYPKAKEHLRKRIKGSKQHILMYCTHGEGWIIIAQKRITVRANQYFILPKNVPHTYGSSKNNPWSIYWVHFGGSLAQYFIDKENEAQNISPSEISRIEERILLFEEMMQNLDMGYSIENINYANICLWHFLASFRYLSQFRQVRKNQERDLIDNSIFYMREKLSEKLTLENLAQQAQLSTSHYSMLFKQKTGRSPLDYFIQLKIQNACRLLDHTHLNIKEIAQRIGYDDPYYFSRIFRKVMNLSPRDYRKNLKG